MLRRLRRILILSLTIFFPLLTILLAALWIDSYSAPRSWPYRPTVSRHYLLWQYKSSGSNSITHLLGSASGRFTYVRAVRFDPDTTALLCEYFEDRNSRLLVKPPSPTLSDHLKVLIGWSNYSTKWDKNIQARSVTLLQFYFLHYVPSNASIPKTNASILKIGIPYWQLLILSSLISAAFLHRFFRHRRRQKRLAQNLCPTCAYDLRAHAPGDNCPECGTPIPSNVQKTVKSV